MSDEEPAAPIAIVGIGCRYPGARGPDELWRVVRDGEFTVRDVPEHRVELGYSLGRYHDPRSRIPGRISSIKAGFIDHPERFDPLPFGLTPRDAAALEPQARMALEVVWDAIVDAGLPFESLRGERVAVMLGHTAEDFSRERSAVLGEDAAMRALDVRAAVGYAKAAVSGRISHQLDLRGPSLTLDTACSSSLYATHLACHSIWRGESRMAFAGGLNLFLTPEGSLALSRSGMQAADGKCKAFDARADGFVRAEGAGVVLLRPLADAVANGDRVYAVIRGTGTSADGRDGGHMMAPGREGQAQAMRDAYAMAGLSPADVDFVEAHGTGTVVGDPVEIAALADVMGPGRDPARKLRVSSIKGNIGHAESASGAAGLIKAALAVRHRTLPAQLHFETPSNAIPWDEIPIEVQRRTEAWLHDGVARVGVNSFGISGTNAHVIVESAPALLAECSSPSASTSAPTRKLRAFPLSAHDASALEETSAGLHVWLQSGAIDTASGVADLAHTLTRRRSHLEERAWILAKDREALENELAGMSAGKTGPDRFRGQASTAASQPLVFVFPGQGGQWLGMARDLMRESATFRASIDEWTDRFRVHVRWSLRDVLLEGRSFDTLDTLQPTLVALQVALADWLEAHGAAPEIVLGQSVGEVAAAAVAGALTRDDTARLACARGVAVQRMAGKGAMALVGLPEAETQEAIAGFEGRIEVAGQNGLSSTLIAGNRGPVIERVARFEEQGVFARVLDVDFASHCFHMDPVLDGFREALRGIEAGKSDRLFVSSVTGDTRACDTLDIDYWVGNLRERVRLADALKHLYAERTPTLVEVSPHPSLGHAISEVAAECDRRVLHIPTLRREVPGEHCLMRTAGELFVRGYPVQIEKLNDAGRLISTPPYPYQKQELWFAKRKRRDVPVATHPLLGLPRKIAEAPDARVFDAILDHDTTPSFGFADGDPSTIVPAGLAIEMALAAASTRGSCIRATNVRFEALRTPRAMDDADPRFAMQTHLDPRGSIRIAIRTAGERNAQWKNVFAAAIEERGERTSASFESAEPLERLRERCAPFDLSLAQALMARSGRPLPRKLTGLRDVWTGDREVLARISLPGVCQDEVGHYALNPLFFENALVLAGALLEPESGGTLASEARTIEVEARSDQELFVHARLAEDERTLSFFFYRPGGEVCGAIEDLATRPHPNADAREAVIELAGPDASPIEHIRLSIEPGRGRARFVAHPITETNSPGAGEVAVAVHAARFGHAECSTALAGTRALSRLGCEVAGVVTQVGEEVVHLNVGDRVFGFGAGTIASRITARADALLPIPDGLSFEHAASLPHALAAAERATGALAAPNPGERVLVLDGDDELAAALVALASQRGARVFCIASSSIHKQCLLRAGASAVACGRGPDLENTLEVWKKDAPFEAVYTTCANHRLPRSFDHFAPTVRWVECVAGPGATVSQVGPNGSLHRVDVEALFEEQPERIGEWMKRGLARFDDTASLASLLGEPAVFPAEEAERALKLAAQRRGHGPVVVSFATPLRVDRLEVREPQPRFDADGVHLVLAGCEADGVFAKRWLLRRGAQQVRIERDGALDAETNADTHTPNDASDAPGSLICIARSPADLDRLARALNPLRAVPGSTLAILFATEQGDELKSRAEALCDDHHRRGGRALLLGIDASALRSPGSRRHVEQTLDRLAHRAGFARGTFTSAPLPHALGSSDGEKTATRLRDRGALRELLEEHVSNVLALGADSLDRLRSDAPLIDLGLDSLLARELALHLEHAAGLRFDPRVWAERPSLPRLLDVAASQLGLTEEKGR